MRKKLIEPGRVAAMAVLFTVVMIVYLVFLYKLQIVEGEIRFNDGERVIGGGEIV